MRGQLLFVLLLLVAGSAYWYLREAEHTVAPVTLRMASQAVRPSVAAAPTALSPIQALASFRSRYHLAPDRRFLLALGDVGQFPSAVQAASVATLGDGIWTIHSDIGVIGTLPEYPDFNDVMALLRKQAAMRVAGLKVTKREVPAEIAQAAGSFDENALLRSLIVLNNGSHENEIATGELVAAATAMARLAYFEDDKTQNADNFYAKALALVALAEAATGTTLTKEEGLLAEAMGYSGFASNSARALTAIDPWRMYITRDDDALEHAARLDPESSELSYLWLRRLGELDRKNEWARWFKLRYGKLPASVNSYDTQLALEGQEPGQIGSHQIAMAVVLNVHGVSPSEVATDRLGTAPVKVITDFQRGLAKARDSVTGPYLTIDDADAYYRGYLYTALYKWCIYLLDERGQTADAKAFNDLLADAPGDAIRELRNWYGDKIAAKSGAIDLQKVIISTGALKVLGPTIYADTATDLFRTQTTGSPSLRAAIGQFASMYDTRPSLRYKYAVMLYYALDLPGMEGIYASLSSQESDDNSYSRLAVYAYDDDVTSLMAVAKDWRRGVDVRRVALGYLAKRTDHLADIDAAYDGLLEQYPVDGSVYIEYLDFLEMQRNYKDAERIARRWLASQPEDKSIFDYWRATDYLAEAQLQQGDVSASWNTISPSLFNGEAPPAVPSQDMETSGYGEALAEGVKIALAKSDLKMAQALADNEAMTYPDRLAGQTERLRVWWSEAHDDQAAAMLAAWPEPIADWQWQNTIGKIFVDVLARDPSRADAAFAALLAAHVQEGTLSNLVVAVEQAGYPDTGVTLLKRLGRPGMAGIEELALGYRDIKKTQGIPAAEAWLKPQLPSERFDEQSMYFYYAHQYEVLWDLIPISTDPGDADDDWLFRAATAAQGMPLTPAQKTSLTAYLTSGGDRWYPVLGRYVMDGTGGEAILDRPLQKRALSEASYYLALRSLATGHYREGAEWLNVDLDTDDQRNGEYLWARDLLNEWADTGQSLAVLAKKGKLFTYDRRGSDSGKGD